MSLCLLFLGSGMAYAETRSLKLYFIHTRERAEITYKRNGKFIPAGLAQINQFLRDWRRNEPTKMDPRVVDLLWEVYRAAGGKDYIHVVSAYRSPGTNAMLRSRSSGVAENSQHMLGKAIDFYIPGVKLSTLRSAAMRFQYGGVGYYPTSGAPFVHIDVGNARYWPRMSRNELMAMFPDGKSVYVPSDGKPLAGYSQALASYKARRNSTADIQLASASSSSEPRKGFLANLFGGGADEDEDNADVRVAAAPPARAPATIAAGGSAAVAAAAMPPSPAAIIASLPAKTIPLPGVAPRPSVDVGTAVAMAAAPAPDSAAAAPASPFQQLALASIPLPTPRPSYTPAPEAAQPAESLVQLASAETVAETTQLRGAQGAAVSAAAGLRSDAPATLAAYVPVPTSRPAVSEADVTMAALSRQQPDMGQAHSRAAAMARAEAKEMADQKLARLAAAPTASPRLAMISHDKGSAASAVLGAGAQTTVKGARPTVADERPDPRSISTPVPRQVARWALSNEPVLLDTRGTKAPSFAHALVRSAPQVVYTAGFQNAPEQADPNRFSGQAVVFLSVARFQKN